MTGEYERRDIWTLVKRHVHAFRTTLGELVETLLGFDESRARQSSIKTCIVSGSLARIDW